MTTELEKTFFDTFGIEPNTTGYELKQVKENARGLIRLPVSEYPQITDRHYLELICLANERRILPNCNVNKLKEYILKELCTMIISENFKHQVQAIFKKESKNE